jgi:excisionase family DNA binding protein
MNTIEIPAPECAPSSVDSGWMKVPEVASTLRCSASLIRRLIHDNELRHIRINNRGSRGGDIRVHESWLRSFIAKNSK